MECLKRTLVDMSTKTNSPAQTAIKIAIIIVVIVVLLLISFAMIKLVPAVFSSISRFRDTLSFFGNKEKITLTLDKKSISSEEDFILSWKQQRGNGEGEHIFNYPCDTLDDDTYLELTEANGDARSVFCEEDVPLGQAGESDFRKITFTGYSYAEEDQILRLTVSHVTATSTTASSSIPFTIKKNKNTADEGSREEREKIEEQESEEEEKAKNEEVASSIKTTTNTISRPNNTSTYQTPADLGAVFTKSEIRSNDDGIVEFQVVNYGQTASGKWRFRAVLPQNGDDVVYHSPYQSSIPGGKASIMTLRFENADSGTVEVIVDYYNEVPESNNNNNAASVRIR
jgi:hypothetical protein